MRTIYKYPIETTDRQTVPMPVGARILCVQVQRGDTCLWAMVDPDEKQMAGRLIRVIGTGNPFPDGNGAIYIGTYQLNGGAFVGHVFEV